MPSNTTAETSRMEINDGAYVIEQELEVHPAALILPPMTDEEFALFKEDILGNGLIEPVILFQGKILDGRNRYRACKELNINVWAREWEGGMDPVEYVVSKNIHRRHLTAGQRAAAAAKAMTYHVEEAKERQREHGGTAPGKVKTLVEPAPQVIDAQENKARERAGKLFNVSGRSVAGAKYVQEHGTEQEKKDLEEGKKAVKPLEKKVRERVKHTAKPKSIFNQTSDSIEWARWTWNPVTGCKHGCPYCYARDFALRYPEAFPNGFEPTFLPERLEAPKNTRLPESNENGSRNVFVCSMADLFGDWVPQEWIDAVIDACRKAPEWTFIFLTKNPKRMVDIDWPENAWVGTTVDCQDRVSGAVSAFEDIEASVKFLSCEPLNEHIWFVKQGNLFADDDIGYFYDLSVFDWVIIGGRSASSGMTAFQPEWEWVESLHATARAAGCKVYWKPNLTVRPKEYPNTRRAT